MDRNSAIGLTLIAVLVLLYFNFFAPKPEKPLNKTENVVKEAVDTLATAKKVDSVESKVETLITISPTEAEKITNVETQDLRLAFSNFGGVIKNIELVKFKTYYKKPLELITPSSNQFKLTTTVNNQVVDFYSLPYLIEMHTVAGVSDKDNPSIDSTVVVCTANLPMGQTVKQIYSIPSVGYTINYKIETSGLTKESISSPVSFNWTDNISQLEKDIASSRAITTINYYDKEGDFDNLSSTGTGLEVETLIKPIKWTCIKQKFFLSAIIADNQFNDGLVQTSIDMADTLVVKTASIKLTIPTEDFIANKAKFKFYFGPNDYKLLPSIAPDFSKNLSLGWPPVLWVNKFLIIPIFHFLEKFISNYGLIIIILVLIIKILLFPLSYTSYLGMAKMRLLKPELDFIKEKNGDNMSQAQKDQMKLYQQAGVNPFSGCIPLLLQMPILFAMFYFFPVSVELRQQSFLWANDLSTYDSIANLPFTIPFYGNHVSLIVILMTISTLVMTWQNNQISSVAGPMKSFGYITPFIFLFVLNSFSSGLSLYYLVSNLVTFGQQAFIRRFVDEEKIKAIMDENKLKMVAGTRKKSKFMTRLEEAMKNSQEARKKK